MKWSFIFWNDFIRSIYVLRSTSLLESSIHYTLQSHQKIVSNIFKSKSKQNKFVKNAMIRLEKECQQILKEENLDFE